MTVAASPSNPRACDVRSPDQPNLRTSTPPTSARISGDSHSSVTDGGLCYGPSSAAGTTAMPSVRR